MVGEAAVVGRLLPVPCPARHGLVQTEGAWMPAQGVAEAAARRGPVVVGVDAACPHVLREVPLGAPEALQVLEAFAEGRGPTVRAGAAP